MERLRQRDIKAMLEFLPEVYSLRDTETFGRNVVAGVPRLISCQYSVFLVGDARSNCEPFIDSKNFPINVLAEGQKVLAVRPGLLMEVPIVSLRVVENLHCALKNSDHISHTQFHRRNIYNEIYRRHQIEDFLDCTLANVSQPAFYHIFALHRDKDFGDRDKLMLEALRPHLRQALQNAQALSRTRTRLARIGEAVGSMNRGTVTVNKDGRVELVTPLAYAWLTEYFERPSRTNALPDTVQRWFGHEKSKLAFKDDIPSPLTPLVAGRDGNKLVIRLTSTANGDLLVLEEIKPRISPRAILERFSLTQREAEVLYWVAEGKTNGEIGIILSMSPRTVAKHLEHIYQKIGVETRTAAATLVVEALK